MRVLVVDDDPLNRDIFKRILERLGAEVVVAGDGREALRIFDAGTLDLVFLDLSMPEMDGMETAMAMRSTEKRERRGRTPIVALSGLDEGMGRLASGIDEFLQKPVGTEALREALERWAARSQI